jgi:GNAT superfamily N-acetyltransferase
VGRGRAAPGALMPELRELGPGETHRAARALLELRPQRGPAGAIVALADAQRAAGYRLVGSFEAGEEDAAGVAGFRVAENLAWGRHLYVDDLSTRADRRGRGHGGALMRWVAVEACRLGCAELHLDSGVGPDREDAHRLYFNSGLRISSYHFARPVAGAACEAPAGGAGGASGAG